MSAPELSAMEIEARLLPPLKDTAGCDSVRLRLPHGSTIQNVIEALVARFNSPKFRQHLYDTEGRIIPGWCAFVNERPVPLNSEKGASTQVKDGDRITFLLNLAGG